MFDGPESENQTNSQDINQDCSERLLEAILPEMPLNQEAQAKPLSKQESEAQANKLIEDAEKELRDANVLPIHVRENFLKALAIKESIYGKQDERLLPLIDRLAKYSPDKEAVKFKERAIEILAANLPQNHVQLAARCTDLASRYRSFGDDINGEKFTKQALDLWQQKSKPAGNEAIADALFKRGDTASAIRFYTIELDRVGKQIGDLVRTTDDNLRGLHSNPMEARLYQKLADCYLLSGNWEQAASNYSSANTIYERYSVTHAQGKVLPDQLKVLAGAVIAELKAEDFAEKKAGNPDWKTNPEAMLHLERAAALMSKLSHFEALTKVDKETINTHYGKDDPQLLDFSRKVASYASLQGDHHLASALLQRLFDSQIAKNDSKENIIATFTSLSEELYEDKDIDGAIKAYLQAVEAAGDNLELNKKLGQTPKLVIQSVLDNNLNSEQLYLLGNTLTQAAKRQFVHAELQEAAIKNLEYAAKSFNKSIDLGLKPNLAMLTEMSSILEIYGKDNGAKPLALIELEKICHDLADNISKHTAEIYKLNPKENGEIIVDISDKVANFYLVNIASARQAVPLLQRALIIEQEEGKYLNVLSQRVDKIAFAQGFASQIKEQIQTYGDFLHYVNTTNAGKDNSLSLQLLHKISDSWQRMPNLDLDVPLVKKPENHYLREALKFKEQEAAMASRLNTENKLNIVFEKALLQIDLLRTEDSDQTLRNILQSNWQISTLVSDPRFLPVMTDYYQRHEKFEEGAHFVQSLIEAQQKNGDQFMLLESRITAASFLEKQGQPVRAQDHLQMARKEIESALVKAKAAVDGAMEVDSQTARLVRLLEEQAKFYERQSKFAQAESTWRTRLETITQQRDEASDLKQNCWQGILRACKAQGKSKEAEIAEQMLKQITSKQ